MNTAELTNIDPQTEFTQSTILAEESEKPAVNVQRNARTRRILTVVAALFFAWFAYALVSAADDLYATLSRAHDTMMTP